MKAVRLSRGLPATTSHQIASLLVDLPATDALRVLLEPLDDLTPFATTFRYPTPRGRVPAALPPEQIAFYLDAVSAALAKVRTALAP